MDSLRKPLFIGALLVTLLILAVELGPLLPFLRPAVPDAYAQLPRPGIGIPYLALHDVILLYALLLMALAMVVPANIQGRIQGIVSLLFFLVLLLAAVTLIFLAITKLMLMVSLLLAVPFGTIAYLAAFADFPVTAARVTLGSLMALKLAVAVLLVFAHQRFIENKGLVLLILSSLLVNLVVSFLHALVPTFLVTIVDALAAIIIGIIAAIWALLNLIGSVMAVVKSVKLRVPIPQ